jgi:hypothetical protein
VTSLTTRFIDWIWWLLRLLFPPDPPLAMELRNGSWGSLGDPGEPDALVVYASKPLCRTGRAGWNWEAGGKVGAAPTLKAAKKAAEAALGRAP